MTPRERDPPSVELRVAGEVTGLRAREVFNVDLPRAAGRLTEAVIYSRAGEPLRLKVRVPIVVEGYEDPELKRGPGGRIAYFRSEAAGSGTCRFAPGPLC